MKKLKELASFLMAVPVLAANGGGSGEGTATEEKIKLLPPPEFPGLDEITVPAIISAAVKFILIVAALVSFIFLVIGGIKWITSGGDKEGTAKAQSTITAALIGLVIVFAAWAIINLLQTFFGMPSIFQFSIPAIVK